MGILDNDTVIVDAILTKLGRQKLANGQPLGVTQYAFGDTGVDYTLYNASHPSGSSAYGKAITDLPMLEAVPDDNVFLRFKLYGDGERNVQNFSFITITSGTSVTISKQTTTDGSSGISVPITIIPSIFPLDSEALYNFRVLDMRGLTANVQGGASVSLSDDFDVNNLPPFDHPNPVIGNITNSGRLELNANGVITSQRTIGVEVSKDGAASAFVTVTIEANN